MTSSCLLQYYFGDFNLPNDRFMQETISENEGCILPQKESGAQSHEISCG